MKILLNASTLRKGGAMQAVVSCLAQISADSLGHTWHLAISDTIEKELQRVGISNLENVHVYPVSPSKNLSARRQLAQLERDVRPDCIFTQRGPAYVRFQRPHLLGCAQGWVTHSTLRAYRTVSFPKQWISLTMMAVYQGWWFRQADAWVTQTETAKRGLQRRLFLPKDRIWVVPNNCAQVYYDSVERAQKPADTGAPQKTRILCFSALYPHKRLDLIPDVARQLQSLVPDVDFEFVLTLPDQSDLLASIRTKADSLGVTDKLVNEGPKHVAEGPELYYRCHVSFLPTVLETFSATYPESMLMGLPIVATDLEFARDVCHDAALYFEPNNVQAAAKQLARAMTEPETQRRLVETGRQVVSRLPSPRELYLQNVSILEQLC